jgi:hypothetical protein
MHRTDLQRDAEDRRVRAERQLAARLGQTAELDVDRRCATATDNLVGAITHDRWQVIRSQLGGGNGGELKASGGHRPKFCSAFSSCALAVNSFGPFVDRNAMLSLDGIGFFSGPIEFEAQRSAGTRGYKPNLDVVAEPADSDWLFVESKCVEYLRLHSTAFSDAFVTKAKDLLSPATAAIYERWRDRRDGYELLDASQLLKHFLAAKIAAAGQRAVTLTYVYWEPADADQHAVFAVHRQEAHRLAENLADDEVRLVSLSYPELWAAWESSGDPALMDHVAALRDRYAVSLGA